MNIVFAVYNTNSKLGVWISFKTHTDFTMLSLNCLTLSITVVYASQLLKLLLDFLVLPNLLIKINVSLIIYNNLDIIYNSATKSLLY